MGTETGCCEGHEEDGTGQEKECCEEDDGEEGGPCPGDDATKRFLGGNLAGWCRLLPLIASALNYPLPRPDSDWVRCYTPDMTLKTAAFVALVGMTLLTVMLAVVFVRDVSSLLAGVIAAVSVLAALIRLLASLCMAIFLYVFYRAQS